MVLIESSSSSCSSIRRASKWFFNFRNFPILLILFKKGLKSSSLTNLYWNKWRWKSFLPTTTLQKVYLIMSSKDEKKKLKKEKRKLMHGNSSVIYSNWIQDCWGNDGKERERELVVLATILANITHSEL